MAKGTVTMFNDFHKDCGAGDHQLPGDTIKVAMLDTMPTAADADPEYADYIGDEVVGTNYTAGGETVGTLTWTQTGGVTSMGGDDVGWVMHASGPTNCVAGLMYNDSAANKECIGFVDLTEDGGSTPVSLQADHIDIEFSAGVLLTLTANPA